MSSTTVKRSVSLDRRVGKSDTGHWYLKQIPDAHYLGRPTCRVHIYHHTGGSGEDRWWGRGRSNAAISTCMLTSPDPAARDPTSRTIRSRRPTPTTFCKSPSEYVLITFTGQLPGRNICGPAPAQYAAHSVILGQILTAVGRSAWRPHALYSDLRDLFRSYRKYTLLYSVVQWGITWRERRVGQLQMIEMRTRAMGDSWQFALEVEE